MESLVKIVALGLVLILLLISVSFAGPFQKGLYERQRVFIIEREKPVFKYTFQLSQELRNLIKERSRIQAQIKFLLRQGELDFEKLQQNLSQLRELESKIFEEFKKDLLKNLERVLRLKNEQKQKVSQIIDKYLSEIRNLRIRLQEKNLEARTLSPQDKEKQSQIKEEIQKLKTEIKEKRAEMLKELKEILDGKQFKELQRWLLRCNIRVKVF